ncbi:tenascin-R-like [Acanthaster planci]|uniref:Tenascin-R-like n=1 Tax=Acanthaster planci TaxID=133434 RepID=A0A8B8A3X1_ACAPL|nr:tenascin-R-like [Acanthaster planci]
MALVVVMILVYATVFFAEIAAQTWRSSSEYVVLDCPKGLSVPTEIGRPWSRVTWMEPRFIDPDGVEVLPARISHNPGERFPVGTHTVKYTLVEGNHKVTCSFIVRVDDEEPPRIVNCPSDITVPADRGSTSRSSVSWDMPLATDNFRVKYFGSSKPVGSSFAMGYTRVTYTAVDLKGNQAKCTFNVIVTDDESPILEGCPAEALTYVPPMANGGPVSWTPPQGIDNSGPPQITCTRSRGENFPLGQTEVVYTATDAAGNTATCSFKAVVKVEVPGSKIFLRNRTSTELEISWPQHVNQKASSYLIYIWPVGTSQPLASDHRYHPINWRESFTTRTLRGLSPGTSYNIRVYVTGVGERLYARLRTRPNAPSGFTFIAESLDSTSVVLSWQPPAGNFDQYQVSYHVVTSDTVSTLRLLDKRVVKKPVNDLDPGTTYIFTLVSVSGVGESKSTSVPTTLTIRTAPLPHSQILLPKVTATSIQIVARLVPAITTQILRQFDRGSFPNSGRVVRPSAEDEADDYHSSDGYVVVIYSNYSDVFTDVIFESGTLEYEFTSLAPTTLYMIRIIPSDASGEVLEKTAMTRPMTVTDLTLHKVTNSSITITWSPPKGHFEQFKVTYAPTKLEDVAPTMVDECQVTINRLVPMTTYVVSVVTIYGVLTSDPAEIEVTPGVDKANAVLVLNESSCISPILASSFLAAILMFIGIYFCRLKLCYKYISIHRRHTEENTYENPTRPNSDYMSSPPYQNTESSDSMTSLIRSPPRPISVSGYMYPPIPRGLFSRGKRPSSGSKENDSTGSPIYYNVKEANS